MQTPNQNQTDIPSLMFDLAQQVEALLTSLANQGATTGPFVLELFRPIETTGYNDAHYIGSVKVLINAHLRTPPLPPQADQ